METSASTALLIAICEHLDSISLETMKYYIERFAVTPCNDYL